MYELEDIGKRISMRHEPTGEIHNGVVEDVKPGGWVIRMDYSARNFLEDDNYLDTTHNEKWTFVSFP